MNKNKRQMKKIGRFILPCIGNGVICGLASYFVQRLLDAGYTSLGVFVICVFSVACLGQIYRLFKNL